MKNKRIKFNITNLFNRRAVTDFVKFNTLTRPEKIAIIRYVINNSDILITDVINQTLIKEK